MCARKVETAARREQILSAAVRVFARQGYAATRVDDVAREAGIAKGSVYLYFDSRDALLAAAFEAYGTASHAVLQQARSGPGPALDQLAALVRSVVTMMAKEPEIARILLDLWAAGSQEAGPTLDMAAEYREYRAVIAELLARAEAEGALRTGVGAGHAAVVVGAIEGCLVQWIVDPELPITELAEPIVEVCVDGLRRREES